MSHFLSPLFQAGFFTSDAVHTALIIGTTVAVVAGALGVFTVMRGQSFAAEAFGDIGTTGGSGAFLVGVGPLPGFLIFSVLAAGAMELVGIQRGRGRDLATGIVLGAALGLAALFLYLGSTIHNTTGAAVTILFGSIFTVPTSTIPLVAVLAGIVVAILLVIHRPLLLSTISPEIATARGVPVRLLGTTYLLALATTVALCALTIGSILSTALLIGPAAAALRTTRRPGRAVLLSALLGVAAVWLGIVLAYDSYWWSAKHTSWPVSFFVVAIVFGVYLLSGVPAWRERRRTNRTTG
ncbi:MAG TPA: metal ABC transporter permease [Solirubrobacteraceae bacterium]|jgi:zinc/manganese transport system permease protein|nr:metal ABC transporter permease [Solirubrobacteraceae bacterium]